MSESRLGPILMVHNYYQNPGGEDRVFADEVAILREHGHEVLTYTVHNDTLKTMSPMATAAATLWNARIAKELAEVVKARKVRIVHFHNTFPLVSPAAYGAVRKAGARVVQTLHNYRLLCANGLLFRDGHTCEACVDKFLPFPALAHKCYRNSLAASGGVAAMLVFHRLLRTWQRQVDAFICLSAGARNRFLRAGLPAGKAHVLANFLPEAGVGGCIPALPLGGDALYLGRLDEVKGIRVLLAAWAQRPEGLPRLRIAGDGPLLAEVQAAAQADARILPEGHCNQDKVRNLLGAAAIVLLPTQCYEGCPMVLLEAFAAGRPVVASRIGAAQEMVAEGKTGFLAGCDAPSEWAEAVARLHADPGLLTSMGENGFSHYRANFAPQEHLARLVAIYDGVLSPP